MDRQRKARPWVRRRRILLAAFGCCVLLAALLAWISWRTDTAIEKQIAAIRAQGYPATTEDLKKAYPPPPKAENAEERLGKNFHIPHATTSDEEESVLEKAWKTPSRSRFAEELRKNMDAYLTENADTLRKLYEAARQPLGRFPVDWQGKGAEYDFIIRSYKVRCAVDLLACEAIVAVEDGDIARAIESILAQLKLGNTLRDEPSCESQALRYKCHKLTCHVIQRMLGKDNLSDKHLLQLADMLRKGEYPEGLTRALVAERALNLMKCDQPKRYFYLPEADEYIPGSSALFGWALRTEVVYGGDLTFYLSAMAKLIEASQHPTAQATLIGDNIQRELVTFRRAFSMMCLPKNPIRELAHDQVELRETMTAIAAERYRLANGKLAENFSDLTPAFLDSLPMDPFDSQPLRFRSDENGYALYSVGNNLADDGGGNDDVVFRVDHPS